MKPQQTNLNWRSLIINRRYLLIALGSGLMSFLILFSGIVPQVRVIFDLNRELKQEQRKLEILESKLISLKSISTEQIYQNRDAVNQLLPSKKPLLELLAGLNQIATSNDVNFVDFKLNPGEIASESAQFLNEVKAKRRATTRTENFDTLDVQLEVRGTFNDMQQFFSEVEQMAPLTTIGSLSLNIQGQEVIQPSEQVQAQLVLKAHYFTQTILAAIESPLPNIGAWEREALSQIQGYFYPALELQQKIVSDNVEDLFGLSQTELEANGLTINN